VSGKGLRSGRNIQGVQRIPGMLTQAGLRVLRISRGTQSGLAEGT
jgi:hypothetical protein